MNGDKRHGSIRSRIQDYRRRMSWDEYLENLDVEVAELHPAVEKEDPYEKGYCEGFIKAWNAQAEMKERTCHDLNQKGYNRFHCSACDMKIYRADQQFNYCPECGARVVD